MIHYLKEGIGLGNGRGSQGGRKGGRKEREKAKKEWNGNVSRAKKRSSLQTSD